MFVATLIGDASLDDALVAEWVHQFDADWTTGTLKGAEWVEAGYAFDLMFAPSPGFAASDAPHLADGLRDLAGRLALGDGRAASFDVVVQSVSHRAKRLLVADMDSTMITVECIDELADYAGCKPQVAAVTEAAMRGELDFAGALDARVALLAGLPVAVVAACLAERVRMTPGADVLIATMRARGARCVLVSGGFTRFAEPVGERLGFDRVVANVLEVNGDRLTGRVRRPIVGADTKLSVLAAEAAAMGLVPHETMAVGDGANDLPMIRSAGLGVAFHAKPVVAAAAAARIDRGDLSALLYAQGIARRDWVRPPRLAAPPAGG